MFVWHMHARNSHSLYTFYAAAIIGCITFSSVRLPVCLFWTGSARKQKAW